MTKKTYVLNKLHLYNVKLQVSLPNRVRWHLLF